MLLVWVNWSRFEYNSWSIHLRNSAEITGSDCEVCFEFLLCSPWNKYFLLFFACWNQIWSSYVISFWEYPATLPFDPWFMLILASSPQRVRILGYISFLGSFLFSFSIARSASYDSLHDFDRVINPAWSVKPLLKLITRFISYSSFQ